MDPAIRVAPVKITVSPVYVLVPVNVKVPESKVMPPLVPEMVPEYVLPFPFPIVSVPPSKVIFPAPDKLPMLTSLELRSTEAPGAIDIAEFTPKGPEKVPDVPMPACNSPAETIVGPR